MIISVLKCCYKPTRCMRVDAALSWRLTTNLKPQLLCQQEQVCGVRHEASVQEVLREIPPGAEEEAEEAVWNRCTEVNTELSSWREAGRNRWNAKGGHASHISRIDNHIKNSVYVFYIIGMVNLGRFFKVENSTTTLLFQLQMIILWSL